MRQGFFDLQSPCHLLEKLRWDFANLEKAPLDSRVAFNFFVTAEHLPDWLNSKGHKQHLLPRICSHLANGAKHFEIREKHQAVAGTKKEDGWVEEGWVEEGWVDLGRLLVLLSPDEAAEYGKPAVGVLELARETLRYWEHEVPQVLARRRGRRRVETNPGE